MALSKKHHFVAQSTLKRFRDKKGNLWHYSSLKGRKVEHRNTETIFHIKHDNTFKDDAAPHDKLEKAFAKLDDDWNRHSEAMITAVESGQTPVFDDSSRRNLFEILHKQQYRSPDLVHDRDQSSVVSAARQTTEAKMGPLPTELVEDAAAMNQILHNAKVFARAGEVDPKVLDAYEAFEIVFLRTSCLVEPFIIGSAVRCGSNGFNIFPLSARVALGLRLPDACEPRIVRVTRKNIHIVQEANKDMARNSKWGIAGCNKTLIERLSRHCPK